MFFAPKTHADAIAPLGKIVKNLRAVANAKDAEIEHHEEMIDRHSEKMGVAHDERAKAHNAANKIETLFA